RRPHAALAALVAVVDRGVHHVDPELKRARHRGLVGPIGGVVLGAEVGADAHRREPQPLPGLEVSLGGPGPEPTPVACGSRLRREALHAHVSRYTSRMSPMIVMAPAQIHPGIRASARGSRTSSQPPQAMITPKSPIGACETSVRNSYFSLNIACECVRSRPPPAAHSSGKTRRPPGRVRRPARTIHSNTASAITST